jgi:hypothetical protein
VAQIQPGNDGKFDAVVARLLTFLMRVLLVASAIIGSVADPPATENAPVEREPICRAG